MLQHARVAERLGAIHEIIESSANLSGNVALRDLKAGVRVVAQRVRVDRAPLGAREVAEVEICRPRGVVCERKRFSPPVFKYLRLRRHTLRRVQELPAGDVSDISPPGTEQSSHSCGEAHR